MVQIEKRRKKKGRPSKADLEARRNGGGSESPVRLTSKEKLEVRRSLRRKSFRYNIIDYDEDYLDEDEDDDEVFEVKDEDEDDEVVRREKKVKLVVKLNSGSKSGGEGGERRASRESVTRPGRRGRVAASRGEDDEEREREVKKRRSNGRRADEEEEEDDDDVEGDDDVGNGGIDLDDEGRDEKSERKMDDFDAPGMPWKKTSNGPTQLPDKKQLELILDKLQKKDTYGVYSEPVDPEELPDYHEVIDHPMDFSTVRKKLADGCYSTLEEFESDVFLISSNAMQYNASDTIYHKQARAIKEGAEKKFQRLRVRIERSEPKSEAKREPKFEAKSEQKERPSLLIKNQIKKSLWRGMQEPVGSDLSSGATLAAEDGHNSCGVDPVSNHERSGNHDGPTDGVSSLADHNVEKTEDPLSGKGFLPKFGKRLIVVDENRRTTYNPSNLPADKPESVFTTFESDKKQLIPVGLSGEYAYARSLARFAGNLGPIAWEIASKKIKQLLPPDFKYGRGWIEEFEPLSIAVVFVAQQKDPFDSRYLNPVKSGKYNQNPEGQIPVSSHLLNQPTFDKKFTKTSNFGSAKTPVTNVSAPQPRLPLQHASGIPSNMMPKRVEPNCVPSDEQTTSAIFHQNIQVARNVPCPETPGVMRHEPNSQAMSDHRKHTVPQRQFPQVPSVNIQKLNNVSPKYRPGMESPASGPAVSAPLSKKFLQSLPFRQPEDNGHAHDALTNGKMVNDLVDCNRARSSSPGAGASFPQKQDQSLSDPVLVMKMLTEKAQRQQNGMAHPHSPSQPRPPVLSPRGDSRGNAAATAASALMSVGASGFRPPTHNPFSNRNHISSDAVYNGTQIFYPHAMQSRADSSVSEKTGLLIPVSAPVQNRPMGFLPSATNDLSRFQVQNPWQGLSPRTEQKQNQKQKQDTLPPDLNVAFQSSVDSHQPDLALQL